jgi:hypothetical protein
MNDRGALSSSHFVVRELLVGSRKDPKRAKRGHRSPPLRAQRALGEDSLPGSHHGEEARGYHNENSCGAPVRS